MACVDACHWSCSQFLEPVHARDSEGVLAEDLVYLIAVRLQPFLKPTQNLVPVTWADGISLFFLHNGTSSWYALFTGYSDDKGSLIALKADTNSACSRAPPLVGRAGRC
jgi:hypothetical protein